MGSQERGQVLGNTIQGGRTLVSGALFLRALKVLPLCQDRISRLELAIAKHVRMTMDQLAHDPAANLLEIKSPSLFGQLTVKNDLE